MSNKPKYEAFTSPIGEAVFPWISKADTAHDKAGVFKTLLSVPKDSAEDFIVKLERIRDEFKAGLPAAKQAVTNAVPVWTPEFTRPVYPEGATDEEKKLIRDAWVGEETGNVLFKFKMKNNVSLPDGTSFSQEPVVVLAETGEAITTPVYGGSIIRVRGQVVPYTNAAAGTVGVSLRMKAVQVIELVSGSGEGSGFWTDFDADE